MRHVLKRRLVLYLPAQAHLIIFLAVTSGVLLPFDHSAEGWASVNRVQGVGESGRSSCVMQTIEEAAHV